MGWSLILSIHSLLLIYLLPSLVELVGLIVGCFLTTAVPCKALSRVPGCIDPPSVYGSVNGIKFGLGIVFATSGDL